MKIGADEIKNSENVRHRNLGELTYANRVVLLS